MLEIVTMVGNVGLPIAAAGLMLWLVWYAVTKLAPRIQESFATTLSEQRSEFTVALVDQRETFKETIETQGQAHLEEAKALKSHVEDIKELVKSTNALVIAHDLTVRGKNDSVVGTTRDIIESANVDQGTLESALRIVRRRGE